MTWTRLDTHLNTCARIVRVNNIYLHGYSIDGTWTQFTPRWFDFNFCQDLRARDLNLGANIAADANTPFARFRSQAWDCEVEARSAVDFGAGYPPFTSAGQFLYEDAPGSNWNRGAYQAQWATGSPAHIVALNENNRPFAGVVALTQATSIPVNAALGEIQRLTIFTDTATQLQNPTNAIPGQRLTFEVLTSPGVQFTSTNLTFGTAYLKTGAFPGSNIAAGKRRTITFRFTGSSWVEVSRADADM